MIASLLQGVLVLAGCQVVLQHTAFYPVAPGDSVADLFEIDSDRTGEARSFQVSFPDTLLPTGPPKAHFTTMHRDEDSHLFEVLHRAVNTLEPERSGDRWELRFGEADDIAWTSILWVYEPSQPASDGPSLLGYYLSLFQFVEMDKDELAAFRAARAAVLEYDPAEHRREIPIPPVPSRRGDLMRYAATFRIGEEVGDQTRVLFLDGTEALIPAMAAPD